MPAISRLPASCATAFVALVLTVGGPTRAFQPPVVQADIDEVVKLLRQKKVDRAALAKQVAGIQKKHGDLNDLMAIYKPTKSKGLGWDPAKKGKGDGIEKRIYDLGTKKELSKAELADEKAHIVRAAYLNLAMVEITKAYTPALGLPAMKADRWAELNSTVKGGSEDALSAVKANDPKALKKAMARIDLGCNACHAAFRPVEVGIDGLVALLEGPKADRAKVDRAVAILHAAHPLDDLMKKVYAPTKRDGIGWDPARKGLGDGIEKHFVDLATKKELTRVQLAGERVGLLRAASYNRAMVEITSAFAPPKPVGGKGAKQWKKHNDEVDAGTKEMIDAIGANDPKALKKAMGRIGAGCNGCHTDFR